MAWLVEFEISASAVPASAVTATHITARIVKPLERALEARSWIDMKTSKRRGAQKTSKIGTSDGDATRALSARIAPS
ncbi:MAG: hypothetical protein ACR2NO_11035 [Chloroflexota bacterium]